VILVDDAIVIDNTDVHNGTPFNGCCYYSSTSTIVLQ